MRGKEVQNDRAVWDPLWEFILDDHEESVDDSSGRRKFRPRSRRPKQKERQPGFFDAFFDQESDYSEVDESSLRSGLHDSRDESNSKRSKEKSEAKRRSQLTENAGVDNSMWDFFGAGQKAEEPNKSDEKVQRRQVIQTEDEQKGGKRGGLFRRFRRKDTKDETTDDTAAKKRQVRVTVTETPMEKKEKPSSKSGKGDGVDPFQMFMEVAGKLDPFGSDHDSDSEVSASVPANRTEDELESCTYHDTKVSARDMDRLVEEARSNNSVNEIRLNFNPIRYKSGKDEYEENLNDTREMNSPIISMDTEEAIENDLEESSLGLSAPRSRINGVGAISELNTIEEEQRGDSSLRRGSNQSQPAARVNDAVSHCREDVATEVSLLDLANSGDGRKFALKKLACCSMKNQKDDEGIAGFPSEMTHVTSPTTRMVSDSGEVSPQVTSDGSNKGLMGVSTDHFAQTKGPQSLYAYDYQTQQHMDVFYTAMGVKARGSMVVRKLGGPPPLMPSSARNEVIIQVEASTVSETDCIIRQGYWWGNEMAPMANTPGVDIVGKIFQVKPRVGIQYGLQASQAVLSLVRWGGNSRYIALDPSKLVKVPLGIDPAEAASLPEMYLSAFQVLHFGQSGQTRYDKASLRGKSVLIVGSMANNMGKAIIELALDAGVANIYATAKQKHWKTLISFGIMPLSQDPLEWIPRVEGTIDLVLASNGGPREDVTPTHYRALRSRTGKLIMCGRRVVGNDIPAGDWDQGPSTIVCAKQKQFTKMMHRSHSYDVFEQWERNLEMCKKDLEHLLELLQRGIIRPTILDRIPLSKVARAHELLESKRLSGFLICEPWMKSKKRAIYL